MRFALYLLWSLACACGMYAAAAVVWSTLDPEGAGRVLLFTIPVAVVAMAVLALVATIALLVPFGLRDRRTARRPATTRQRDPRRPDPRHATPSASPNPTPATPPDAIGDNPDDLVLAA